MKAHWLVVQSFQQSQDLLDSINTLSIHTKLELAGIPDEQRTVPAEDARRKIGTFLEELRRHVEGELNEGRPVVGASPRVRRLARTFERGKRDRVRFRSLLFRRPLSDIQNLLHSPRKEDKPPLLECLKDLRVLIEEHVDADAMKILGEL